MSLPSLTDSQRAAALRKATAVRMERREFKLRVEAGDLSLLAALDYARDHDAIAGIRVVDLLKCLPGTGPRRAEEAMVEIGIAMSRRLRGLGENQRQSLVERFEP